MPTYTTNYNLAMYDNTADITETFQSYRNEMCFTSGSNVTKIEAALTAQQTSIDSLELTKGDITVPATFNAGSLFEASGISEITSYVTGMVILLYLDQDSNGTVTLDINSLGVKSVLKIDDSGSSVNLENNDLRANKRYEITYNGSSWIMVDTNYHIFQNEGSDVAQRDRVDFQGASVLVQDGTNATEVIVNGAKWDKNIEALSGNKTLTDASEPIQVLTPDAARDINLPAEAVTNPLFTIQNPSGSGFDLTMKDDSPATIVTIQPGQTYSFISDGIKWYAHFLPIAETANENILVNGGFRINQEVYISNAVLASGEYGHDMWKAGAGGGDYTFTQLASATQITIKSGKTLIQVVEDKNVAGGNYTLSWEGTAEARAGVDSATPSGAYAASPLAISSQTAGTVMSVEFDDGTLGKVKLEPGAVATPYAQRQYGDELKLCERYYQLITCNGRAKAAGASDTYSFPINFGTMRVAPTATETAAGLTNNLSSTSLDNIKVNGLRYEILSTASGDFYHIGNDYALKARL